MKYLTNHLVQTACIPVKILKLLKNFIFQQLSDNFINMSFSIGQFPCSGNSKSQTFTQNTNKH